MKRVLSLVLALMMLLSAATLLFSCGGEKETKSSGGKSEVKTYDEDSIFYERSLVSDDLPEKDYGGRDFRVVTHMENEIFIPEEDRNQGDLIKDAKFARNQAVENRFNVNINVVYSATYAEVSSYVQKTVLSGTD